MPFLLEQLHGQRAEHQCYSVADASVRGGLQKTVLVLRSAAAVLFLCVVPLLAQPVLPEASRFSSPPTQPGITAHSESSSGKADSARAVAAASPWIDTASREAVRSLYHSVFMGNTNVPMGFTGDLAAGLPGTTSSAYQAAVWARLNWFRNMAGLPGIQPFDAVYSRKAQQAALMMSVNGQLSHEPLAHWLRYTAEGAEAAGRSNLCLGFNPTDDPGCIRDYMRDHGEQNESVGHRRWFLYPQTLLMGTGDVPGVGLIYWAANAVWVIDGNVLAARPAVRDGFVAWPPPGYVPYTVMFPRWSFSYPGSDFRTARVTLTRGGVPVPVVQLAVSNGYGENTLVWVADNLNPNTNDAYTAPTQDTTTTVRIEDVLVKGVPQTFTYAVTMFDPSADAGQNFSLVPATATLTAQGGSGTASLMSLSPTAAWTARSSAGWLVLTSPASGTGSATLAYTAVPNPSGLPRQASITIGGAIFAVSQAENARVTVETAQLQVGSSGASGIVNVTPEAADYAWTPVSSEAWIHLTGAAAKTGKGSFSYTVDANPGASRAGFINVGGASIQVQQSGSPATAPELGDVLPAAAVGNSQTFTVQYKSTGGVSSVSLHMGAATNDANACWIEYLHPTRQVRLYEGSTQRWTSLAQVGTAASLATGACRVNLAASSVDVSVANQTTLFLAVQRVGLAGRQPVRTKAIALNGLQSDWLVTGAWWPAGTVGSLVNRYRLFGTATRSHLHTTDANEYNVLGTTGIWNQEGVSGRIYNAPASASGVVAQPYYRIYNVPGLSHFWTADRNEYLTLIRVFRGIYEGEGIDGFVMPSAVPGSIPLYRLVHRFEFPIKHHWTTDANEYQVLGGTGTWRQEGVAGYLFPAR